MEDAREAVMQRLRTLIAVQKKLAALFDETTYNVFVFGSYVTTRYVENVSDIDIAVYTKDFDVYKQISMYLEEYFEQMGIPSDIFYIDTSMVAPVYCAPLQSQVQFTDYYPTELTEFYHRCRQALNKNREMVAG